MKKVAVFCSSKNAIDDVEWLKTKSVLTLFTIRGYDLVYGGSKRGLMGKVAEHFKFRGRKVTSVFPISNDFLLNKEDTICAEDVFERKKIMLEIADVYLVLSGGLGTFDELLDAIIYCGKNKEKQICIFNYNGFYDDIKNYILKIIDRDFALERNVVNLTFANDSDEVFEFLIKKYKDENADLSTRFFLNYFGISRFPNYFVDEEFLNDDNHFEVISDKILNFLIMRYEYEAKHCKKFTAIYWALIFTIETMKPDFDDDNFRNKMNSIYEQNSFKQSIKFRTTFDFEYFLFQNFSELDSYAKYFNVICQRLESIEEKEFFVNACWIFVENFKEVENIILKIKPNEDI